MHESTQLTSVLSWITTETIVEPLANIKLFLGSVKNANISGNITNHTSRIIILGFNFYI